MNTPTPADPNEHVPGFHEWAELTKITHLIEHGHNLRQLRRLSDEELDLLHTASHQGDGHELPAPPDLPALADKAVSMAAGMREHIQAGRWGEAYAAADWLIDLADEIHSHVWAAHPEARPETW